ncbi:MAG TPA: cytochrome c [Actinobacteria bacterium]|nr:cytochrome c [Actinomycetota bacterium]
MMHPSTTGREPMVRLMRQPASAVLVAFVVLLVVPSSVSMAQSSDGRELFESSCAGCHGADGSGTLGVFPPLVGNDDVQDGGYLREVIRNGRTGEIEVAGITYDGTMPPIGAAFSDDEVDALVGYIQSDLGTAERSAVAVPAERSSARFPWGLAFIILAAVVLSAGLVVMVARPGHESFTWKGAYARALVLFFYFFLLTVWLPSTMFTKAPISGAPRVVQDVVVSGAWFTMMAAGIVALRFLQKAKKI